MSEPGAVPASTRAACRRALTDGGFRRRAGDVYTLDLDGREAVGRVGLSTATNGPRGRFELNPIVGVHHVEVEGVRADLMGQEPHAYNPATLLSSIGYLTPDRSYRAWFFEAGTDFDAVAADLAAVMSEYGVPFMLAHTRLDQLIDALENVRYAARDSRKTRLPIAYELDGRPGDADAALEESLKEVEGEVYLAAEEFRSFARRFRERFR